MFTHMPLLKPHPTCTSSNPSSRLQPNVYVHPPRRRAESGADGVEYDSVPVEDVRRGVQHPADSFLCLGHPDGGKSACQVSCCDSASPPCFFCFFFGRNSWRDELIIINNVYYSCEDGYEETTVMNKQYIRGKKRLRFSLL